MDFNNLDLPVWFIIILLTLSATKGLWLNIIPDGAKRLFSDRELESEHRRQLEQARLDYELQKKAADEAQDQLRDAQFNKYFDRMMSVVEESVINGNARLGQRMGDVEASLARNRRALLELAGLLGALYSKAKNENGKVILEVIREVDDIMEQNDQSE